MKKYFPPFKTLCEAIGTTPEAFNKNEPIAVPAAVLRHLICVALSDLEIDAAIYREQNIILRPFENDVTRNFHAKRMFMGAQGVARMGVMEADPLLIQAEQKLINQGEELVLLIDSSKFRQRSSLILCPLARVARIITDSGLRDEDRAMVEAAGVALTVVEADETEAQLSA